MEEKIVNNENLNIENVPNEEKVVATETKNIENNSEYDALNEREKKLWHSVTEMSNSKEQKSKFVKEISNVQEKSIKEKIDSKKIEEEKNESKVDKLSKKIEFFENESKKSSLKNSLRTHGLSVLGANPEISKAITFAYSIHNSKKNRNVEESKVANLYKKMDHRLSLCSSKDDIEDIIMTYGELIQHNSKSFMKKDLMGERFDIENNESFSPSLKKKSNENLQEYKKRVEPSINRRFRQMHGFAV